uniref:Ribonucleases P/MRP protein subunit POP1 n=1 Tax=Syphacia muris TaxID=451379 RepID=A0A0N5A9C3_9BILA
MSWGQLDDELLSSQKRVIDVNKFVETNIKQVSELLQAVDNDNLVGREVTKGPRTVLQRLPRHMRRRAMSYNVKRLPRRRRSYALQFIKASRHRKKPPSRFRRRRPRNLLQAYARRNRKNIWLETHIWHAKRFFMIERWGYKIPFQSFQRAFRPTYRDSVHHCVIQDMSFLRCIQIVMGDRAPVLSALHAFFSPLACLTPASKFAEDGRFEVSAFFYKPNEYPKGFIGPIRFMWSANRDGTHCLVIWTHPSISDQVLEHLIVHLNASKLDTVEGGKGLTADSDTGGFNDISYCKNEYLSNSLNCTVS